MPHKIVFNIGAKIPTIKDCIRLKPNEAYIDVINKNQEYIDVTQKSIIIQNLCNVPFEIPEMEIFSDNTYGGNFKGSLKPFMIAPNQNVSVPVYYNGIYKGDSHQLNYTIQLNGTSVNYQIDVVIPFVNTPPVVTDIVIGLDNRENKTFTLEDFLEHYYDADGHELSSITLHGDTSMFRLNGNIVADGTTITRYELQNEMLGYIAKDTDDEVNVTVVYNAKDELGATSN